MAEKETRKKKEKATVVSPEMAELEFERFADAMDLDVDESFMDESDRASFDQVKRTFIRAVTHGHLIVDDAGRPVYTPHAPGNETGPITFNEPRGDCYMAMDSKKSGHNITRTFAVMAAMTQKSVNTFAKMEQRDLKVCQAITTLFLG